MTMLVFSGLARHDYQKILRVCARQMITFAQDKKNYKIDILFLFLKLQYYLGKMVA